MASTANWAAARKPSAQRKGVSQRQAADANLGIWTRRDATLPVLSLAVALCVWLAAAAASWNALARVARGSALALGAWLLVYAWEWRRYVDMLRNGGRDPARGDDYGAVLGFLKPYIANIDRYFDWRQEQRARHGDARCAT